MTLVRSIQPILVLLFMVALTTTAFGKKIVIDVGPGASHVTAQDGATSGVVSTDQKVKPVHRDEAFIVAIPPKSTRSVGLSLSLNGRVFGRGDDLVLSGTMTPDNASRNHITYIALEVYGTFLFLPGLSETPGQFRNDILNPSPRNFTAFSFTCPNDMTGRLDLNWYGGTFYEDGSLIGSLQVIPFALDGSVTQPTATPTRTPTPVPTATPTPAGTGNDLCTASSTINLNNPTSGTISSGDLRDYWEVTLPRGTYTARLQPSSGNDFDLEVFDTCPASGIGANSYGRSSRGGSAEDSVTFTSNTTPNTVYILVEPYQGTGSYDLEITSPATPTPVPTNTPTPLPARPEITWEFTDGCADGEDILIVFFDNTNDWYWPSPTTAYVIPDGQSREFRLNSWPGDSICFGAEPRSRPGIYWGVSLDNDQSCSDCCTQGDLVDTNYQGLTLTCP